MNQSQRVSYSGLQTVSVVAGMAVLFAAIAITFGGFLRRRPSHVGGNLLERLPTTFAGWQVEDLPVAATPEMKRAVDELLNFDHAVFRQYRRGDQRLDVYAAYWQPGKFHPRLIAIHTPDVCWVGNGWRLLSSDYSYSVRIGTQDCWPAQERLFQFGSSRTYVLYWHILNGKLSGYAQGPESKSGLFLANLADDMRAGSGEQYFLRISSEQSFKAWQSEPLFEAILRSFAPVLLAKAAVTEPSNLESGQYRN